MPDLRALVKARLSVLPPTTPYHRVLGSSFTQTTDDSFRTTLRSLFGKVTDDSDTQTPCGILRGGVGDRAVPEVRSHDCERTSDSNRFRGDPFWGAKSIARNRDAASRCLQIDLGPHAQHDGGVLGGVFRFNDLQVARDVEPRIDLGVVVELSAL
jgi:hypothetical protein